MMDIKKILEEWKSPLVARTKIAEFTKGAYKASSFSVYDSIGGGVVPSFRINKKVFYFVTDVVSWLKKKKGDR